MRKIIVLSVLLMLFFCSSNVQAKLVGPHKGQVIDAHTGLPVVGASVLLYWVECIPRIIESCQSEPVEAEVVYTDKEGQFRFGRNKLSLSFMSNLESSDLVIYQPGFKFYRDSGLHNDPVLGWDWGTIRLERVPPNFDHRKHYDSITDSIRQLDDYTYGFSGKQPSVKNRAKIFKKIFSPKKEFIRRARWEYLRGEEK